MRNLAPLVRFYSNKPRKTEAFANAISNTWNIFSAEGKNLLIVVAEEIYIIYYSAGIFQCHLVSKNYLVLAS